MSQLASPPCSLSFPCTCCSQTRAGRFLSSRKQTDCDIRRSVGSAQPTETVVACRQDACVCTGAPRAWPSEVRAFFSRALSDPDERPSEGHSAASLRRLPKYLIQLYGNDTNELGFLLSNNITTQPRLTFKTIRDTAIYPPGRKTAWLVGKPWHTLYTFVIIAEIS